MDVDLGNHVNAVNCAQIQTLNHIVQLFAGYALEHARNADAGLLDFLDLWLAGLGLGLLFLDLWLLFLDLWLLWLLLLENGHWMNLGHWMDLWLMWLLENGHRMDSGHWMDL